MMTAKQFRQMKTNLELWEKLEESGISGGALWEAFTDARHALRVLITEVEDNTPLSLWQRIKGVFGG